MKKWEYKVIGDPAYDPEDKQRILNILGKQGWELICVDGGWHIFKRELNNDFFQQKITGEPDYQIAQGFLSEQKETR